MDNFRKIIIFVLYWNVVTHALEIVVVLVLHVAFVCVYMYKYYVRVWHKANTYSHMYV